MKTITATEFKNRAAEVLKEVSTSGKTVIGHCTNGDLYLTGIGICSRGEW